MKNVLVPVDFGPEAENAIESLASVKKWWESPLAITLVHCVDCSSNKDLVFPVQRDLALDKLIGFAESKVPNHILSGGSINCEVLEGKLEFLPQSFIQSNNIDLVVMGTSGADDDNVLSTCQTAEHIVRHSGAYLIIPSETPVRRLQRILLCVDYQVEEPDTYDFAIELAKENDSEIHVLHVVNKNKELTLYQRQNKEKLREYLTPTPSVFHEFHTNNIVEGILDFSVEMEIDLICTVPRHNTFLDRFFHLSVPKKLAQQAQIPIYLNS